MKVALELVVLTINFIPIALLAWTVTRPEALHLFRDLHLTGGESERISNQRDCAPDGRNIHRLQSLQASSQALTGGSGLYRRFELIRNA
jgi:hypothetical protein